MAGLQNRLRRIVVDGRAAVTGLAIIGDALCVTNPTFGRGSGHAVILAEALAEHFHGAADEELTHAVDDATVAGVGPYFRNALAQDTVTRSRWRRLLFDEEAALDPDLEAHALAWETAFRASMVEREVWDAVTRTGNLLRTPEDTLADPVVAAGIRRAVEGGLPSAPEGPSRADVLAAATAAAG